MWMCRVMGQEHLICVYTSTHIHVHSHTHHTYHKCAQYTTHMNTHTCMTQVHMHTRTQTHTCTYNAYTHHKCTHLHAHMYKWPHTSHMYTSTYMHRAPQAHTHIVSYIIYQSATLELFFIMLLENVLVHDNGFSTTPPQEGQSIF